MTIALLLSMLIGCQSEPSVDPIADEMAAAMDVTEDFSTRGNTGNEHVRGVIKKNRGQVQACFESRVRQGVAVDGRLSIDATIHSGRITTTTVIENSTADKELERCVVSRLRRWQFDAEMSGVYSMPFVFAQ